MSSHDTADHQNDDAVHQTFPRDVEMTTPPACKDIDPFLVTFEEPFDADNPKYASYRKRLER